MQDYVIDWQQMLFGTQPLLFYIEILVRTGILYAYTLVALRMLGRRSAGELTPLDLVIVISLGSAVGDPMFYPQVPVLHGIAVITLVTFIQATIINLTNRVEGIEAIIKGQPIRVIKEGVLDVNRLKDTNMSREEVFMALRQQGYESLGQIERMYIETDGKPSVYPFDLGALRPGLPIKPPRDIATPPIYHARDRVPAAGQYS
ncbi:MAG: DUF421 domain-containing protein, partial [Chloroflexi bacterium]|nr:DUF421 domain-containing protein [Chloroflexota bacterium]